MGRLDFVSESTYIIFAEGDLDMHSVCFQGVSHHSVVVILVADVEYVLTESLQHFLAEIDSIEEGCLHSFLHCHLCHSSL